MARLKFATQKTKSRFFEATGFNPTQRFRTAPQGIYHVLCLLQDVVTKVHYHLQVLRRDDNLKQIIVVVIQRLRR